LAEEMHRPDPYAMAEQIGNGLLAEWRAYYRLKREQAMQEQAAARAESNLGQRRR
jgi:hypothetical protein